MMIRLGLERISRLLAGSHLPWRAIHVAGTNGKGSICAALSNALITANVGKVGQFTSPHLIDRWDCISINGRPISAAIFLEVEAAVKARDAKQAIGASEFELLTATAFEIFTKEQVQVAVVECGMGGLMDATNVLAADQILATVISHISLDHQSFLGNTVEAIAKQKAGIIKSGSGPCIIDGNNEAGVLAVVQQAATDSEVRVLVASSNPDNDGIMDEQLEQLEKTQRSNLACAMRAFDFVLPQLSQKQEYVKKQQATGALLSGLMSIPGRYQTLSITSLIPSRSGPVLLDGAHNIAAWQSLSRYVTKNLRPRSRGIVWVFALSGGRALAPMVETLAQNGDSIVFTEFGPVEGMPWVQSNAASDLAKDLKSLDLSIQARVTKDIREALLVACDEADHTPVERDVVIAGSLYLVSDVLRLQRASAGFS